jgi:hypothetical protein
VFVLTTMSTQGISSTIVRTGSPSKLRLSWMKRT